MNFTEGSLLVMSWFFFRRSWARRWWSSRWSGWGWSAAPPSRRGRSLVNGHRPSILPQIRKGKWDVWWRRVGRGLVGKQQACHIAVLGPASSHWPDPARQPWPWKGSHFQKMLRHPFMLKKVAIPMKYKWNFLKVTLFDMVFYKTLRNVAPSSEKTLPEAQRTQILTPWLGLNIAPTWCHLH